MRHQCPIPVNAMTSCEIFMETWYGVPEGSVLGLLLFLIFINDLPDNLICNPKLFADDVSLNAVMYEKNVCTNSLNVKLKRLFE